MRLKHVDVYCDGACSGNPGPGGWGAVLLYKGKEKRISGYSSESTNNRMELTAAIMALGALREMCDATVYTDSAYICNAFNNGWILAWERNGWVNSKKQPVENQDLWLMLVNLTKSQQTEWVKVKGHSNNEYNNICDKLARDEIKKNVALQKKKDSELQEQKEKQRNETAGDVLLE